MGAGSGRASVNKVPMVIGAEQYLRENSSKSFRIVPDSALCMDCCNECSVPRLGDGEKMNLRLGCGAGGRRGQQGVLTSFPGATADGSAGLSGKRGEGA